MLTYQQLQERDTELKALLERLRVRIPDAVRIAIALWGRGQPIHALPWAATRAVLLHQDCIEAVQWTAQPHYNESMALEVVPFGEVAAISVVPNTRWANEYWIQQGNLEWMQMHVPFPPAVFHIGFTRPVLGETNYSYPVTNEQGRGDFFVDHLGALVKFS